MENLIIPFGKYKGNHLAQVYAEDEDYLIWCQSQPWFKEKYSNIYNIVINQNNKSNNTSKTPEHNKIQNLFLDKQLCKKLIEKNQKIEEKYMIKTEFESKFNWDVLIKYYTYNKLYYGDKNSIDESSETKIFIEIKPTLGDDYPNVLRKMKMQREKTVKEDNLYQSYEYYKKYSDIFDNKYLFILIINNYDSVNTSKEILKEIFYQSDILVIFLSELGIQLKDYLSIEDENNILKKYLSSMNIDYNLILNS